MRNDTPPVEGADEVYPTKREPIGSDDAFWVRLASDAYYQSENYFDSAIRRELEDAMAHFNNRHAPGSKYHTRQYAKKSKFFRPKTRSAIRRNEMALAVALFSTDDVVNCQAYNEADEVQVLAAEVKKTLLNYRLKQPETYWYLTAIGGGQDALNVGSVISRQHWKYETRGVPTDRVTENTDGTTTIDQAGGTEIVENRPAVDLVPLENIRIDPAADWRDPMLSSPYVIELVPMYAADIRKLAEQLDPFTGEPVYAPVEDLVMRASANEDWDSIRRYREGTERLDRYAPDDKRINEYRVLWVHRNIVRVDGFDFTYDTLGPTTLLSAPKPLEDVYRHLRGRKARPYRMGFSIVEAHKLYPAGITRLTFSTQEYTNDIGNLRQDNLRLTLNKRYWVRRGAQVDVKSLIRNVAGGVTMMSSPDRDVKETSTPDVTSSSYEEQDRLNADFDDIAGSFSGGSVQTNRQLNETVGGMKMLHGGADQMQEYQIRTISETWIEGVLQDMLWLEETYESDPEVLQNVAGKHDLTVEDVLMLLQYPTRVIVNVGFDSTDPEKRINKLAIGLQTFAQFFPDEMQRADKAEIAKVIFGALGYRDGSRFLPALFEDDQDPRIAQLEQTVAQLQSMLEGKQMEQETKIRVAEIAAESRIVTKQIDAEIAAMKEQAKGSQEQFKQMIQARLDEVDVRLKAATEERERMRLALEREALSHSIVQADRDFALRLEESRRADRELMGTEAKNLAGEDSAGVISRGDYGAIPDNPR